MLAPSNKFVPSKQPRQGSKVSLSYNKRLYKHRIASHRRNRASQPLSFCCT